MPAAFISPIIMEQGYTWEINFDLKQSGTARNLTGYTGQLTASAMLLSGIVSAAIGRVSFSQSTAQTSARRFDRIAYEFSIFSGTTVEKVAVGDLVMSTAIWAV